MSGVTLPNVSPINVTVSGGLGPAIIIGGTSTSVLGVLGVHPFVAGPNVTVSTSSVGITISAADSPVASVQGRTGNVVVSLTDLTGAASVHTHSTSDVSGLAAAIAANSPVVSVQGRTGSVVVSLADLTGAAAVHTHSTSDVSGFAEAVSANSPVASVQGMTGAIVITIADLTAAASVHTHSTSEVSGLVAAIAENSPVASVQGYTGTVLLSVADLTASPAVHTHSTSDVSGLATAIVENSPVVSVQGRTGSVVVSLADVTGAAAVHTHATSEVSGLTAAIVSNSPVASVQGRTGSVVVSLADLTGAAAVHTHSTSDIVGYSSGDSLPPQSGNANRVLSTDGTAAAWASRFSVVDSVIAAGAGVSLTKDTTAGSITIEAAGGTSGVAVGSSTPQPLGVAAAGTSGDASREDHVHALPTIADITAAPAVHTHSASDIGAVVHSVNGITGQPVIVAGSGITVSTSGSSIEIAAGSGLPSQVGNASKVLSTDGEAASWVTRFSIVDPVLLAGDGILLSVNTTAGSITIGAAGGTSGVTVGSAPPQPLGVAAAGTSGNAAREDHVHALPTISDISAAAAVHTHSTSDVSGLASAIASNSLVSSVQGYVGTVVLSVADLTAAPAVHTHSTNDVSGLSQVVSVNGQTGVVVLSHSSVSAASSSHTHATSDIAGFSAAAAAAAPVQRVAGRTGEIVLAVADVANAVSDSDSRLSDSRNPLSHTHSASEISNLTTVANVVSVNGMTGVVTVTGGGGGGGTAVSVATKSPTPDNFDVGTTDVVRVQPTSDITITGMSGGSSGVVRLLVNVTTHDIVLSPLNSGSDSTNQFLFAGGDRRIRENDSASTLYDATSQKWRLISQESGAPPYYWANITATSSLHDYSPGTSTVFRVSSPISVTGFSGGGQNKALRIVNVSTNTITLVHNSTASEAQNRLLIDTGTNRVLDESDQAELLYDPYSLRWRVTPCCDSYSS